MSKIDVIKKFLKSKDYNLQKKDHNQKRWMDQKLTADILFIVADCIQKYCKQKNTNKFKIKDIWFFEYTMEKFVKIFKKPNLDNKKAKREYDKVFSQPMELLAFAEVLEKRKVGRCNEYELLKKNILKYIASEEMNAFEFLNLYIEEVLRDNDMWQNFSDFFEKEIKTEEEFQELKQKFESFLKSKTNIKANSSDECNRIFAKVLNTLAFFRNSQGSYRGSLSKDIITKEAVVYNRENFRDKNSKKPKVLTRQEHEESSKGNERKSSKGSVRKARNELNEFNKQYRNYKSEHIEKNEEADATVTHHIFPQKPYSEISSHLENLISLTPTQHSNYAHNNNRTKETSKTYQRLLLLSKIERIKEHLSDSKIEKKIYKFSNLLYVLSVGFNNKDILNIEDGDFDAVIDAINRHYAS